jgi:hypothetical protein
VEKRALLVCLGIMEKSDLEKVSGRLDSDCSTAPISDGRHGRIRSRIGTVLKLTFIWIRTHAHICPEVSAIYKLLTGGLSIQGAAPPYFGPMGRVSSWIH